MSEQVVHNVADPEQVKARGDRERERLKQEAADLKWVLSDRRGRRFYRRLVEHTGVFQSSFTGNSETFFREGRRDVGLKLMADLTRNAPEAYSVMMQEKADDE